MKKVIALGIATCFAFSIHADQQITNTGKTFLRFETPFQSGSQERVADFAAEELRTKHRAKHNGNVQFNGDVQFIVFGGQNASQSNAAQYYFPSTNNGKITFNAAVDASSFGTDTLQTYWNGAQDTSFGADSITQTTASQFGYTTATADVGVAATGTALRIPTSTYAGTEPINSISYSSIVSGVNGSIASTAALGQVTGQVLLNGDGGATAINDFALEQTDGSYLPYNLTKLSGLVDEDARIGAFNLDTNRNTAIVRPWNFGIGYAPNIQMQQPVAESTFVSTIAPELERSHWGIGATWKQILSEKDTGFWIELSTALQRVTMNMDLNEVVTQELVANAYNANTDPTGVHGWETEFGYTTGAITTVAQAFAQDAWNYGKIDGAQSMTRLADIEFKVGYQFICEENVLSNGYVGMIIPTGNKATAEYMAEPIVGNGFHFGLMAGGTYEIQLNGGENTRWSMRADTCYRYLFQNTQKRSFDTNNGNWSRYMYVWENYAAEQLSELDADAATMRSYTPGINVFTKDVNVTPQAQVRYNQALILESGGFKGELGWNVLVRQNELVSLVNPWVNDSVVYADASNIDYSLYNANRTIYNDAYQSTPVQYAAANGSQATYNAASVQASDLNLNSAASWGTMTNTPYLVLGYGFNEERSSVVSIGGSYEFCASNSYINDWMLWGKFSFTF